MSKSRLMALVRQIDFIGSIQANCNHIDGSRGTGNHRGRSRSRFVWHLGKDDEIEFAKGEPVKDDSTPEGLEEGTGRLESRLAPFLKDSSNPLSRVPASVQERDHDLPFLVGIQGNSGWSISLAHFLLSTVGVR